MNQIVQRTKSFEQANSHDAFQDLRNQLSTLELNGSHRRFLVNRMGGTGSSWLVKLLNTHPDVFCYHEGVLARIFPSSSYLSDDIVTFIRWLAEHDMHGAYRAVGDVGSAWTSHIAAIPQGLFTTGILLRHPARILNTRLKVFRKDKSFTEISSQCLRYIEERWAIQARQYGPMDQIFLQDLANLRQQIETLVWVDVVMQMERMNSDIDYCKDALHQLTGLHYELTLIEPLLDNPVNCRTDADISIPSILTGFTKQQQSWYRLLLSDLVAKIGYPLEDDLPTQASASKGTCVGGVGDHGEHDLQQMLADRDRRIARLASRVEELEAIWRAVQNSAGWRLLNSWRRARRRLLPAGTRVRKFYEALVGRLRRPPASDL